MSNYREPAVEKESQEEFLSKPDKYAASRWQQRYMDDHPEFFLHVGCVTTTHPPKIWSYDLNTYVRVGTEYDPRIRYKHFIDMKDQLTHDTVPQINYEIPIDPLRVFKPKVSIQRDKLAQFAEELGNLYPYCEMELNNAGSAQEVNYIGIKYRLLLENKKKAENGGSKPEG